MYNIIKICGRIIMYNDVLDEAFKAMEKKTKDLLFGRCALRWQPPLVRAILPEWQALLPLVARVVYSGCGFAPCWAWL